MVTKTKTKETLQDTLLNAAQQAGTVIMTAAMTLSLLDAQGHQNKLALVGQPAVVTVTEDNQGSDGQQNLRREREETGPHYTSYTVAQRTPGRTGKA